MQFTKYLTFCVCLALSVFSYGIVDGHEYQFNSGDDIQNASRAQLFRQLAEELRCPKCQNQNLADSNAMIAGDLRRELYSQVKEGKNSEEIVDFMVNRYGEFVLYRPALNDKTIALWYGPFVLLGLAVFIFISVLVARKMKTQSNPVDNQTDNATERSNVQSLKSNDALSDEEQKRLDALLTSRVSDQDDNKG